MSAVLSDPVIGFRDAIERAGLTVPDQVVPDGELHRFASNGNRSDDSGWYVLHLDGLPAGSFGCWRSGLSETWRADTGHELSDEERREYRERVQAQRRAKEAEETRRQIEASAKAAEIWNSAKPGEHAYLTRKGIKAHAVRVDGGRLVIPMRETSGKLTSLQFIDGAGNKKFLTGGKVSGAYHSIGKPDGVLCIAEGYATAASIHEATGHAVAVAFNAGNLKPVAMTLRRKYPDIRLVICADDDTSTEGNPGMTKANAAAETVNAAVAVPVFGGSDGTDFNDLHQQQGTDAVRTAIESAVNNYSLQEPRAQTTLYRRLSEVKPEPINWLWQGRIAKGKVSIIAGDPGLGKSQTTASMAAVITTGGLWPVDRVKAERGNVIFLSAEDDAADTIRPRLDAAGADATRIYILDAIPEITEEGITRRAFNLKTDPANLEAMVTEIGGAALIVIDPISAYLGSADSHKNAEIRALLAPLSDMASRLDVAVIGVSHLNKSGAGGALSRVTGSLAFVAAARATYIVSKDQDEPSRRLFLPAKNNIGPDQTGLAFTVEGHEYDGDHGRIQTSRVMWEKEAVTMTADEAVAQHDPEERSEREDAKEFLKLELSKGAVAQTDIKKAAGDAGHAWSTVRRAKSELGILSKKTEFAGIWQWSLPSKGLTEPEGAHTNNVSILGNGEHLRGEFGGPSDPDAASKEEFSL